ncbi:hypothetical protein K466DRAFT_658914 [Polyporus arcularius HHB13444]|uniref:F-box domain-containing protein n=1 Tax=Polyporus arcularius HHB13444 TaxID=1314778 RepID=A0A5C3PTD1_9APHY|nr:hypothetical protein K466DRAFT_658914 [Polyporus arcularius HHB13444]
MSIQSSTIARPLDARLLNVDVLASVFDELEWDEYPVESRATCARAARVCHSFASVALPKVWRWLPDFVPLWILLLHDHVPAVTPSKLELFSDARNQLISNVKDNKLYQDASCWGRFLRYASYVQRLDRVFFMIGEIDLLRSVIAHNDHCTFLPGLRRLAWMQIADSGTTMASLSSTSLVELHLHTGRMASSEELMALLPSRILTLRKLVFISVYNAWDGITLVKLLTGMKHLQSLRLDSNYRLLHYSLLRQLFASLPLEHLYFYIANLNDLTRPCLISAPHLRFLECKGAMADMVALLPHLQTPSLTTFKFESLFKETSGHVSSMCTILSQRPFSDTLKGISLAMRLPFGPPFTLQVVDLLQNLLYPILSMSCLESLSFVYPRRVTRPITITDEDIATIARALPNLKCLEVIVYAPEPVVSDHWVETDQSTPSPPPPLLSVASLVHIAQYSPHLEELHLQALRIDLEAVPVPTSPPTQSHPLQLLTLRDPDFEKHVDDMTGFLRFLDRLFPNLQSTGQRHAVPRSLQPQEQSYLYDLR